MTRLVLPGTFWRDHHYRWADWRSERRVLADHGRTVTVELDQEALDDLRYDAWYYSPPAPYRIEGLRPIIRSAQATVRALVRQGIEPYQPRTSR